MSLMAVRWTSASRSATSPAISADGTLQKRSIEKREGVIHFNQKQTSHTIRFPPDRPIQYFTPPPPKKNGFVRARKHAHTRTRARTRDAIGLPADPGGHPQVLLKGQLAPQRLELRAHVEPLADRVGVVSHRESGWEQGIERGTWLNTEMTGRKREGEQQPRACSS